MTSPHDTQVVSPKSSTNRKKLLTLNRPQHCPPPCEPSQSDRLRNFIDEEAQEMAVELQLLNLGPRASQDVLATLKKHLMQGIRNYSDYHSENCSFEKSGPQTPPLAETSPLPDPWRLLLNPPEACSSTPPRSRTPDPSVPPCPPDCTPDPRASNSRQVHFSSSPPPPPPPTAPSPRHRSAPCSPDPCPTFYLVPPPYPYSPIPLQCCVPFSSTVPSSPRATQTTPPTPSPSRQFRTSTTQTHTSAFRNRTSPSPKPFRLDPPSSHASRFGAISPPRYVPINHASLFPSLFEPRPYWVASCDPVEDARSLEEAKLLRKAELCRANRRYLELRISMSALSQLPLPNVHVSSLESQAGSALSFKTCSRGSLQAYNPVVRRGFIRLSAHFRGKLTRDLLATERVVELIRTIKDTAQLLLTFHTPNSSKLSQEEKHLVSRLHCQLKTSLFRLHEMFFVWSPGDRICALRNSTKWRAANHYTPLDRCRRTGSPPVPALATSLPSPRPRCEPESCLPSRPRHTSRLSSRICPPTSPSSTPTPRRTRPSAGRQADSRQPGQQVASADAVRFIAVVFALSSSLASSSALAGRLLLCPRFRQCLLRSCRELNHRPPPIGEQPDCVKALFCAPSCGDLQQRLSVQRGHGSGPALRVRPVPAGDVSPGGDVRAGGAKEDEAGPEQVQVQADVATRGPGRRPTAPLQGHNGDGVLLPRRKRKIARLPGVTGAAPQAPSRCLLSSPSLLPRKHRRFPTAPVNHTCPSVESQSPQKQCLSGRSPQCCSADRVSLQQWTTNINNQPPDARLPARRREPRAESRKSARNDSAPRARLWCTSVRRLVTTTTTNTATATAANTTATVATTNTTTAVVTTTITNTATTIASTATVANTTAATTTAFDLPDSRETSWTLNLPSGTHRLVTASSDESIPGLGFAIGGTVKAPSKMSFLRIAIPSMRSTRVDLTQGNPPKQDRQPLRRRISFNGLSRLKPSLSMVTPLFFSLLVPRLNKPFCRKGEFHLIDLDSPWPIEFARHLSDAIGCVCRVFAPVTATPAICVPDVHKVGAGVVAVSDGTKHRIVDGRPNLWPQQGFATVDTLEVLPRQPQSINTVVTRVNFPTNVYTVLPSLSDSSPFVGQTRMNSCVCLPANLLPLR
ncbi:unnamed protein product [Mesocestoides corti]|uniref:Uncharacterized protein n=1 Tax=Mesocestoides corti TaxID=53468 RepID=A0A0R3UMB3_MESCO|nr:unnamed protein product [Mesocestoides corti]